MSAEADLENRIRTLEDIESIKKLKAKYWRCVDTQQWDELAECFAEDVVFENPFWGNMAGKDHIIRVLKRAMRTIKTSHQGHNPEIEIADAHTAKGRWALNDRVLLADGQFILGYGHYDEEYFKENITWKIRRSKLTYIFQDGPSEVLKSFKY
jgi:hypothetical protein